MLRKTAPFVAAVIAGFLLTGIAQWMTLPNGAVYTLIGFVGGILLSLGIPFAFGLLPIQSRHQMHPNESAVIAEERRGGITLAYDDATVLTNRLEQDPVGGLRPLVVTTGRAVCVSASSEKSPAELVKVGHLGQFTHETA